MKTALYAAAAVAALSAPCAAWAAQGMVPPEVEGVVVTANRAPQPADNDAPATDAAVAASVPAPDCGDRSLSFPLCL